MVTKMTVLIELLRSSVIIQGLVTFVVVVSTCYLYINQVPVPDALAGMVGVILGFYFGNKVNYQTSEAVRKYEASKP